MNADKKFTREDLLYAWLRARRYRDAHKDLREYHSRVYSAFCKAFGVNLDTPPPMRPEATGADSQQGPFPDFLYDFFTSISEKREACSSPFSGLMAAPPVIHELYRSYHERIDVALGRLVNIYGELMIELIGIIWGIPEEKAVSQTTLNKCGFPREEEPDFDDFW